MKRIILGSTCFLMFGGPVFADTFSANLSVTSVVLHPDGAALNLATTLDLPAGRHDVILTGLGDVYQALDLPLNLPDGVRLISVRLASGRLPVVDVADSPEVAAARAEVERLEAALIATDDAIAALAAPEAAANARIATLTSLGQTAAGNALADADAVAAIALKIGEEVGAARAALETATAARRAAERARDADVEALDRAQQALAALLDRDDMSSGDVYAILTVDVANAGPAAINIETQGTGSWAVGYEANLESSSEQALLTMTRKVSIYQETGRDWSNVDLVLSTNSINSTPSATSPYGRLRYLLEPDFFARSAADESLEAGTYAAPVVVEAAVGFVSIATGESILYAYPEPVTLRTGVEELTLDFGTVALSDVTLTAIAAPQTDPTAYREVRFTNASDEVLIGGPVDLRLDGVRVGTTSFGNLAPDESLDLPFGAIDTIKLSALDPTRNAGGTGFFVRENEENTSWVYTVENFGTRDWPIEVKLGLSYAEDEEIVVSHAFSIPPVADERANLNGQFSWTGTIDAGAKWDLRVDTRITWPSGMALQ